MNKSRFQGFHSLMLAVIVSGLSFSNISVSGQDHKPGQAVSTEENEIEKADKLMEQGTLYLYNKPDSAIYYYKAANVLYSDAIYPEGTANAWYKMIQAYRYLLEFDSALSYAEEFISLSNILDDSLRKAKGLYQMGLIMDETDFQEAAINYHRKSLALFYKLNNSLGIFGNYNALGNLYKVLSEYDSAASNLISAAGYCEQAGDEKNLATIYSNLGDVYLESGQLEIAGKYYQKAFDINVKHPDRLMQVALNYNDFGRLASEKEDYARARENYDKSLELYKSLGDLRGELDIYNNLGDLYFSQEKYKESIPYFEEALAGYRELDFLEGIVVSLGNLAAANAESGFYQKATTLHDTALSLARRLGSKDLVMDVYQNISDTYYNLGEFEKAFEYQDLRYALKDSIFNLNKTKVINDLLLKYEKEKDQAQILALEGQALRKTIQRNGIMYSSIGIIIMLVFGFLYFRQRAAKDKIIAAQKIRQLEEEKKLMVAKKLMEGQEEERKRIARELHDGLGVLLSATKMQFTTIRNISPENGHIIDKATQLLEQASGDVRKISHNMMPGLLTKLGLYEAVEDLFENINDAEGMNAEVTITGEHIRLPENNEIMLYRVIQELVNNTIKHAQAGNIRLKIDVTPDQLDLFYQDDGQGFDVKKIMGSDTESLGLKSIQSRVEFLNGSVEIESGPGEGTRFWIQVPVG